MLIYQFHFNQAFASAASNSKFFFRAITEEDVDRLDFVFENWWDARGIILSSNNGFSDFISLFHFVPTFFQFVWNGFHFFLFTNISKIGSFWAEDWPSIASTSFFLLFGWSPCAYPTSRCMIQSTVDPVQGDQLYGSVDQNKRKHILF